MKFSKKKISSRATLKTSFSFMAAPRELEEFLRGAPGRIRTSGALRAIGLQPIAIDHSATDAINKK